MTQILVLEDEAHLRESILDILRFEGFEAIGAEDGCVGVELARQHLPDLIVSDIMMPKLDGYEVFLELHKNPETETIPFIFLTAKIGRGDIRKGMEFGADDYLTKPFAPEELIAAIQTQIKKHASLTAKYEQKLQDIRYIITHNLPHEFRTPLTGILSTSQWLIADHDNMKPDVQLDMLNMIHQSGQRLYRLIENYLLYTQLETARVDDKALDALQKLSWDTDAGVVIYIAATKKADKADRSADLVLEVDEKGIFMPIPEQNLEKIVDELVDNACKFSEPGTPIHVKTASSSDTFSLHITNSGRGMTPEQIASIGAYAQFERKLYEQQGSGLGLIIAMRLTELHGGELTIESIPDQQITMHVTLPRTSTPPS